MGAKIQDGYEGWHEAPKNGAELFNPIFVFLISYKFTTFIMKIMFGILKYI